MTKLNTFDTYFSDEPGMFSHNPTFPKDNTGELMNLSDFALSPAELALELADKLDSIKSARDVLIRAKEDYTCTCSGFILQYEGSCQCDAGDSIKAAEAAFWELMKDL